MAAEPAVPEASAAVVEKGVATMGAVATEAAAGTAAVLQAQRVGTTVGVAVAVAAMAAAARVLQPAAPPSLCQKSVLSLINGKPILC